MKSQELISIIRQIVAEEVKSQLPQAIVETFQEVMGTKKIITETKFTSLPKQNSQPVSLKEMLSQESIDETRSLPAKPFIHKQYTKNSMINAILNETTSDLIQKERQYGLAKHASVAVSSDFSNINSNVLQNDVVNGSDPAPKLQELPPSIPSVGEVSVLDIKNELPDIVSRALNKNYSQLLKLVDKKRSFKV